MRTLPHDSRIPKHAIRRIALAAFLTAVFVSSESVLAEATAVVNDGTLEITATPGETQGVLLTGHLTEKISVFADGTLVNTFPRTGISRIEVLGVSRVTFRDVSGSGFEFEGDIVGDLFIGGVVFPNNVSRLDGLSLRGDLLLRGHAGTVVIDQASSLALIEGNVTVQDGGFGFPQFPGSLWVTGDLTLISISEGVGGFLEDVFVGRDLIINGGPHNEFLELRNVFVERDALMSLGQSTGGDRSDFDADFVDIGQSTIKGDLIIDGEQGDDTLWLRSSTIEGNLYIDMGPAADEVRFFSSLILGTDTQIFLDGGNGTSDELILNGFLILDGDEYTGFETVTP